MATPPIPSGSPHESVSRLRRLSAELRRFRSPNVQSALTQIPVVGADAAAELRDEDIVDPAAHAAMFAMKAELRGVREELERTRKELGDKKLEETRMKRQMEERVRELEIFKVEKKEVVAALEKQVSNLEESKKWLERDVREKDELVRGAGLREQRLVGDLQDELERKKEEAKKLKEETLALERECRSLKEVAEVERTVSGKEMDLLRSQVHSLEMELSSEREARKSFEKDLLELSDSRANAERGLQLTITKLSAQKTKLFKENSLLRKEKSELAEKVLRLEDEVRRASATDPQIETMKATIGRLKEASKRASEAGYVIKALTEEKAKVTELVASLTPNKDAAAGFEILRLAAANPSSSQAILKASNTHLLQRENASHKQELASLNKRISGLNARFSTLHRENTSLQNKIKQLTMALNSKKDEAKRTKHLLSVVEVERTGLRDMLRKIEESLRSSSGTVTPQSTRLRQKLILTAASATKYKAAAAESAVGLAERDEQIASLTARLSALTPSAPGAADGEASTLRARLVEAVKSAAEEKSNRENAEEAKRKLERECGMLRNELEALGKVPEGVKVIHAKKNPLSKARLAWKAEGGPLKRRRLNRELDTMAEKGTELEVLRRRVSELEKKENLADRYREIAKRKIEELRTACYNIFGWEVRVHGGNYTVASMYAEREEEKLIFSANRRGGVSLIENSYCDAIKPKIDQYLRKFHSVPALLAEITFENFEKTTLVSQGPQGP